jgi:hypothetical protein
MLRLAFAPVRFDCGMLFESKTADGCRRDTPSAGRQGLVWIASPPLVTRGIAERSTKGKRRSRQQRDDPSSHLRAAAECRP